MKIDLVSIGPTNDLIFKDLIFKLQIDSESVIDSLMNYYKHLEIDTCSDVKIRSLEKEINNIYAKKDKKLG